MSQKGNISVEKDQLFFYVGSYGEQGEATLHKCTLNITSGEISLIQAFAGAEHNSYVAVNRAAAKLYAVQETAVTGEALGGSVVAVDLDGDNKLTKVTSQSLTGGEHPCYLYYWEEQQVLLAANYSSGNVAVIPLDEQGNVLEASSVIRNGVKGSGVNPERQQGAYAHCISPIPGTQYVCVADLGMDAVLVYRYDEETKTLHEHTTCSFAGGAGPRHIVFHPNLSIAYVANELDSSITVLAVDKTAGTLERIEIVSSIPTEHTAYNDAADLHLSEDGRFLYSSNRGHNSIAAYEIDKQTGQLTAIQHISSGGELPRNFVIAPGSQYIIAANQKTNSLNVFVRDTASGQLTATAHQLSIPTPVCIKFMPAR